jgi:hypothetical protein
MVEINNLRLVTAYLIFITLSSILSVSYSFVSSNYRGTVYSRSNLMMVKGKSKGVKAAAPSTLLEANVPRKIKRTLRTIKDSESFKSKILTTEIDGKSKSLPIEMQ